MTTRPLTDQQSKALSAEGVSVALDAGAGCGKTFVLTERFVRALSTADAAEPANQLSRVVAITFTEAAASELRARVRLRCRELRDAATGDDRRKWGRLLRSLDAARISTIHSFCAALIREHAVVLGIAPGFRVLDPAAEAVLRSQVVDATLRAALTRAEAQGDELLLTLAAELEPHRLAESVKALTHSAGDGGFPEWTNATPDYVVQRLIECYRSEVLAPCLHSLNEKALLTELRELVRDAQPTDEHRTDFDQLAAALDGLLKPDCGAAELDALRPLLSPRRVVGGRRYNFFGVADFAGGKEDKERFGQTLKAIKEMVQKCAPLPSEADLLHDAERALCVLRLAGEAHEQFLETKRNAGWLGNDDLLTEARRLLTSPELSNESDAIASGIDLLLVDEFQDTDPIQTDIVRAVAGVMQTTGGLFVVGDYKQSIYRFRGAQPEVFRELRKSLPERGRLPLSTNFRSQPGVLGFVNALFAEEFAPHYEPLVANRTQSVSGPSVEFLWTDPPAAAEGAKTKVHQRRRAEAGRIAGRLRAMIDSGEPLVVGEDGNPRPVRQGDVAILFRSLGQSAYYEDALRRAGLDYYVVGGQAFYAQQEVYDVVHLLTAIDSQIDDVALLGVLRSPLFGLSDDTLLRLTQRRRLSKQAPNFVPPEGVDDDQAAAVRRASRVLAQLRSIKNRVPVAELLEHAVELTAYDAALLADFLGERKLANLDKIIEQAREHDAAGGDLAGFRRRLEHFVTQPPKEAPAATTSDSQNVVRLMTVHQSKGLEFPVVVVADLDRENRPGRPTAMYSSALGPALSIAKEDEPRPKPMTASRLHGRLEEKADAAEEVRLFYVACTRAADRLILSACPEAVGRSKGPSLKLLSRLFDLETGERLRPADSLASGTPAGGVSPSDQAPLVEVTPAMEARPAEQEAPNNRSLDRLFDNPPAPRQPPASVLPVPVNRCHARYSVSRLNGSLHRASSENDETQAPPYQQSNGSKEKSAFDPLGFGTLVHAVLERIDPRLETETELDDSVRQWSQALAPTYLARNAGEAAIESERLVSRFLRSERWRSMASAPSFEREAEFLLRWPENGVAGETTLLQGYIDAAYRGADGHWRIVDYKTNRVEPDDAAVAAAAELYRFQLCLYAMALEQALGESPAELVLCFLRPGAEWRFPWTNAEREATRNSINLAIEQVVEQAPHASNPIAFV